MLFGSIGLPIRPVAVPNTWSGYDPVNHPDLRYLGGVRPRGVKLIHHYIHIEWISTALTRPPPEHITYLPSQYVM